MKPEPPRSDYHSEMSDADAPDELESDSSHMPSRVGGIEVAAVRSAATGGSNNSKQQLPQYYNN